jgi:cyclophilin family peptidyl-prolyl cis-trans isomerase
MRQVKVAQEQRHAQRRRRLRRGIGTVVIAAGVVGIILLITSPSSKPKKAATSTTTSTIANTTVSTAPVSHVAIKPVCPPATTAGAPKRAIVFTKAPPTCITTSTTYLAHVTTDVGTFVITMNPSTSLAAVNNFVFLARYHFYDGVTFHRVIPGFVVQGGDPTGTGSGGPGYSFTGNKPAATCPQLCYPLGSVAMANSGTTASDGSQFFIVVGTSGERLPPNYTLFGQVTSGMNVVQTIAAGGTPQGVPPKILHHMVKVTISEVPSKG